MVGLVMPIVEIVTMVVVVMLVVVVVRVKGFDGATGWSDALFGLLPLSST